MNKSVVLKDYNGDVCYPKVNKNNIIGYPYRPRGDVKIFFGFGEPSSNALNYKNIEVNDLYFDMNLNGKFGIYYRCNLINSNNITWDYCCNYILSDRDPITGNIANWYAYNKILPFYKAGLIWCNTTTGELFLSKPIEVGNIPSWANLTDTYSKSEVNYFISNINNIYNKMDRIEDTIADSVITLVDSSNRNIPSINIMGKSEQVKTNGYQLSDLTEENYFNKNPQIVMGTTIKVSKGSIINAPSGSPFNNSNTRFLYWVFDNVEVGRTYTIKVENNGGAIASYFSKYNPNPTSISDKISTLTYGASYTYTFTAENNVAYVLELRTPTQGEGGTSSTPTTMTIMLNEGNTTKEWEEYTGKQPSPSIDYPQEITDITQEDITVKGKNLISLSDLTNPTLSKGGISSLVVNDFIEVTATKAAATFGFYKGVGNSITQEELGKSIKMRVSGGQKLFISFQNNVFNSLNSCFINKDLEVVALNYNTVNTMVTVPSGAHWLLIRPAKTNCEVGETYRDNIQVEVGTSKTDFEYYSTPQQANLTKTLRGIPVSSGGNYTDNNQQWLCDTIERYKDGSGKLIQRVASFTFDGTEDWQETGGSGQRTRLLLDILSPIILPADTNQNNNQALFSCLLLGTSGSTYNKDDVFTIATFQNHGRLFLSPTVNGVRMTVSQWTDYLTNENQKLIGVLATPIETPLTAEELAELDLSTYKPVTNIISNTDIEVTYVADTKNWIDNKCEQLQNAILSQGGNV